MPILSIVLTAVVTYLLLIPKFDIIMATFQELSDKVDALQVALDTEQAQIKEAIDGLNTSIEELTAMVQDGGTPEQRQALADKLDAIKTDLEGTIPDDGTVPDTDV